MFLGYLEALRRLHRAADKAVRRAVAWAPLAAALLGGAIPARASSSGYLNIAITVQGIGNITDLAAVPGASTGTISLAWTEPYHTVGVAPYSYDVRVSTVGQIANDTVFSTSPPLATFSPSVAPSPGSGGGAAGFVAAGLTGGVTYYFAIREKDSTTFRDSWIRSLSPPLNVDNFAVPNLNTPAPAGGSATAVFVSSITAAWSVSASATDYMLVASTSAANPPTLIAASSTTLSSTATVAGLAPDTTYFLFVTACGAGCSPYALIGSTITLAAPALSLSTTAVSSTTVSLTWSPNGNPAGTNYLVERSTDGVSYSTAAASVSTSTSLGGLTVSTSYYFAIVAQNFAGVSAATSNVVEVFTPTGPPAPPAGGAVLSVTTSTIIAAWNVSTGATDYTLVASTSAASPPVLIAASSATLSSTATLSGLAPNTSYFLFVSACDFGCSPYALVGSTITLAAPAVGLSTTSISSSTVGLAWSPNGDPLGTPFLVMQSTDGVTYASVSTTTLTGASVFGLTGGGTYYYEIVAVNGAGIPAAPSNVVLVLTPAGPVPSTPTGLTASAGLLSVSVTWNALPPALQGQGLAEYRLLRSTNSGVGFVQIATGTAVAYMDRPLAAGVTEYYKIVARDIAGTDSAQSAPVSAVPFTESPMEPLGVSVVPGSTTVTLTWSPTSRFFDGTPFVTTGTPNGDELQGYSVYRSTNICDPNYVQISTLSISSTSLTDNNRGLNYYYRLFSFNSLGVSSNAVTISSLGEFNYFTSDCTTNMTLDAQTAAMLSASANGVGDIRILPSYRPQDVSNGIFQSAQWTASLNGASTITNYVLPKPGHFSVSFLESNGVPVPAVVKGAAVQAAPAAGTAANVNDLGMYWFNGQQYVKMYGKVDPVGQTVSVDSPNLGIYQIRAQARSAGAVFDISNLSSRVITPNGDGLNDTLIFTYDPGPNNVVPAGKIFDLRGTYVADMAPGLVPNTLTWNGFMNGMPVHSGVYVYRITGDGKTFTGTIVVAR
jgi:fibronectin type 3 domain-containing protein